MHPESIAAMKVFIESHLSKHVGQQLTILDIGSYAVADHQSYRPLFDNDHWRYIGVDIEAGPNVDIALARPYQWDEIEDNSADVVISGQALEHIMFFWATVMEIGRVLRPGGLACVIAPSCGVEHRYPVDCWRFYPDGMAAIARWIEFELVEARTDWEAPWGDSVLIMRKPIWHEEQRKHFAERIRHLRAALPLSTNAPRPSVLAPNEDGV